MIGVGNGAEEGDLLKSLFSSLLGFFFAGHYFLWDWKIQKEILDRRARPGYLLVLSFTN